MTKFFLGLYRFFSGHKGIFYSILTLSTILFAFFAAQVRFEENISVLLPKTDSSKECAVAFNDIKVKDKVFVEAGSADDIDGFMELLLSEDTKGYIANSLYSFDTDDVMNLVYYAMEALPCHINPEIYPMLDSVMNLESIDGYVNGTLEPPVPDMGSFSIKDSHICSPDGTTFIAFLSLSFNSLDTKIGGRFEKLMSRCVRHYEDGHPGSHILYHGTPCEGTFNARQIKKDLVVSLTISIILVLIIILICFKRKRTAGYMIVPVCYGTLFSLACIYWIKGYMSFIAIGIGAIVLGVALSYCLHVIIHKKFVSDVQSVIRDEARPVCLGCITTIGAFLGLMFTSSELLQDFGMFASFALVGTTFFALAFLPQFFNEKDSEKNDKAFEKINKFNAYPIEKNKIVVLFVVTVCIVCLFTAGKVKFDSDLNNIGHHEPKLVESEKLYNEKVNDSHFCQYFAAHSGDIDSAIVFTQKLMPVLDSLKRAGAIYSYSGVDGILVPAEEQRRNIAAWKEYWTPEKTEHACEVLKEAAEKYGWNESTGFDIPETFRLMVEADYEPVNLYESEAIPEALLCNFTEKMPEEWLVFSNATMDEDRLKEVCAVVGEQDGIIILDPYYYTGDMVEIVHRDFNVVLMISSIFVFFVLLLSFRSLLIALIAFMPMALSWYVVQGIMAIFGIEFNLINIVISSFIFGIGVDYSIFVMEGLISKAKNGEDKLIFHHKAAIFFSATILLVVTATMLIASHPAIHSIGISTIIGMTSTILITYTLEPLLFNFILSNFKFVKKTVDRIR